MTRSLFHAFLRCGAAFVLTACSRPPEAPTELVRPVRTLVVAGGEDTGTRTFPGRVDASKQVELTFQVPGLLVDLPVREGQRVAQGDLIARLRHTLWRADGPKRAAIFRADTQRPIPRNAHGAEIQVALTRKIE